MKKLLVSVLGNSNSGKSMTWNTLFSRTVKTGTELRRLYLNETEYILVFLVSGSPEERETYVGDIITKENPSIVLCSMQYREDVKQTFQYFTEREYKIYCHWLNPGFHDPNKQAQFDTIGIFNYIIGLDSIVGLRNAKINLTQRVQEIKEYIYGWAKYHDLLLTG